MEVQTEHFTYRSWTEEEKTGLQRFRQEASNGNGEALRVLTTDPDDNIQMRYRHQSLEAVFLVKFTFLNSESIEFRIYRASLRRQDPTVKLAEEEVRKIWNTVRMALEEWPANWYEPDLVSKNTILFV